MPIGSVKSYSVVISFISILAYDSSFNSAIYIFCFHLHCLIVIAEIIGFC